MVSKNRGIYGFLCASWVPITMASRHTKYLSLASHVLPGATFAPFSYQYEPRRACMILVFTRVHTIVIRT